MRHQTRTIVTRVQALEATGEPEGGYTEGHLPDQPAYVQLTNRPGTRHRCSYTDSVISPDGVSRVLLPGGRTVEVKPCPKCVGAEGFGLVLLLSRPGTRGGGV
jgi:hypothetical protein